MNNHAKLHESMLFHSTVLKRSHIHWKCPQTVDSSNLQQLNVYGRSRYQSELNFSPTRRNNASEGGNNLHFPYFHGIRASYRTVPDDFPR